MMNVQEVVAGHIWGVKICHIHICHVYVIYVKHIWGVKACQRGRSMMTATSYQDLTVSTHALVAAILTSKKVLEKFGHRENHFPCSFSVRKTE